MVHFQCQAAGRHYAVWFLLSALLLPSRAASQDNSHAAVFVYPTEEGVYYQFDQIRVIYTSEISSPSLYVWCRNAKDEIIENFRSPVPGPNGSYTVTINFTSEKPCWLNIKSGIKTEDRLGNNSPGFNVIGQTRASGPVVFGPESRNTSIPTSSDPSKPSTYSTTTSTSNSPQATTPLNDISNFKTPDEKSSGLGTGAVAGIAVGASLGSLAIAGGIFAYFWRRRQSETRDGPAPQGGHQEQEEAPKYTDYAWPQDQSTTIYSDHSGGGEVTGPGYKQGHGGDRRTHELDTANTPVEMPS